MKVLGRHNSVMIWSQETCQFSNHRYDLRSMGMEISSFYDAFFETGFSFAGEACFLFTKFILRGERYS